jgi:hypothetical protein
MHEDFPFPPLQSAAPACAGQPIAHLLYLHTFSYQDRHTILPALADAMAHTGCWILARKQISLTELEIHFEIKLRAALELYSGLIAVGLELTRASHLDLTGLCTLRNHNPSPATLGGLVHVRLAISFLEEMDLQSVILPGAARA